MIRLNWQSELPACQEERLLCCHVPDQWLWLGLHYSWAITLFFLLTCHLQVIAFGQMASWQHGYVTAAWLFPTPPKSALGYTELIFLLPASLPALQTSLHRSQLFQQLENCSGWGLLPPVSQHSSGHGWNKAQRDLTVVALIRVTAQCKCSVTAHPGHSWSGEIIFLLMQAGPDWYLS